MITVELFVSSSERLPTITIITTGVSKASNKWTYIQHNGVPPLLTAYGRRNTHFQQVILLMHPVQMLELYEFMLRILLVDGLFKFAAIDSIEMFPKNVIS